MPSKTPASTQLNFLALCNPIASMIRAILTSGSMRSLRHKPDRSCATKPGHISCHRHGGSRTLSGQPTPAKYKRSTPRAIADAVHAALVATLGVPETDRLLDPEINGITLKTSLNQRPRSGMAPDTRSGNRPVEDPWPVLGRKVAPTRVC